MGLRALVGERGRIFAGEAVIGELRADGIALLESHRAIDAVDRKKGERIRTAVETLAPAEREEEIARMLAGAEITDAARAAARALMHA